MMHHGMDLSRFKKVSSDKKSTTLRHAKGHEIKIAHSGLTPKMREDLEKLAKHEDGVKQYAEGTPDEPVGADDNAPEVQQPLAMAAAQPDAPEEPEAPANPVIPPKPERMPQAGEVNVIGVKPPQAKPAVSDELKAQDAAWDQDLKNGHITPETYQSLFDKKDTLGKVGTLFGMMLSGFGSGVTGQPNAVMQMMKDQITNDLEAQKASKTNAHNFLQLNQQHQMNEANIKKLEKEGLVNEAQARNLDTESKTKAYALARMQMNRAALHNLVLQTNRLPVGSPQRQAAEQQLALLTQGIQGENFDLADKAAAASALGNMAFGQTDGGDNPEGNFQRQQTTLRMSGNGPMADDKGARHFPGLQGQASIPLTSADREQINSGITFQDQMKRFMDWTKAHSGDISPSDRGEGEALAGQLQGAYRMATHGGVYKEGEQGFISHIIDSTPTKFFNSIRVMPKLEAVQRESAAQLDQLVKSKGFKGYAGNQDKKKTAASEGQTGTYEGKPVIFSGGKWKYK